MVPPGSARIKSGTIHSKWLNSLFGKRGGGRSRAGFNRSSKCGEAEGESGRRCLKVVVVRRSVDVLFPSATICLGHTKHSPEQELNVPMAHHMLSCFVLGPQGYVKQMGPVFPSCYNQALYIVDLLQVCPGHLAHTSGSRYIIAVCLTLN
jgi:hypothetical protein